MTKDGKTSKEEIGKKERLIEQIADELEEDINVIQKTAEELMKRNAKESPEVIQKLQEIHHLHTYYSVC